MDENKTRLRPVVYTQSYFKRGTQNTAQQMFLLKALQITQDPKKLRDMIGVKSVAQVYSTLDKLVMRKEYHKALSNAGISFDYIVKGLKGIADEGFKDSDKLKALQTLLKSVGMEKYDTDAEGVGGSWEDELMRSIEAGKKDAKPQLAAPIQYEVKTPEIPESARKIQEDEDEMTSSIYENKK